MTPAVRLSLPFIIIFASLLVVAHFTEEDIYATLSVPFVIGAAVCYVFAPQINWKYYLKNPPVMDDGLRRFLEAKIEFYQKMHPFVRKKFRNRVMLFIEATDWKAQVSDEFPGDMKICIAASAVRLLMNQEEEYLFKEFEEHWHVSEIYEEDGVVMLAAQPLLRGFINPKKYYPIALHEYAKVFKLTHPDTIFPEIAKQDWAKIQQISGYSEEIISKTIGLPDTDMTAVGVVIYFTFPKRMVQYWPEVYRQFNQIFPLPEAV